MHRLCSGSLYHMKIHVQKWAVACQNQQNGMCAQRRLRYKHGPSLIRVFAVRMKKAWVLSYPLSAQWRLWSNWADAQADLSLRWTQRSFCLFCRALAQLLALNTLHQLSCRMTKSTKCMYAHGRPRSARASVQSDQSLLCAQWVAKYPKFLHADSKAADLNVRWALQLSSDFVIQYLIIESNVSTNIQERIFSSPEPKAHKASLYDRTRTGVRVSVCVR